jgi:cell pole-organizing protein PopZ
VAFIARPLSLEMQLSITDQMALGKALKAADADPERWLKLLQALPGEWDLHVKQMEVGEEEGERTSYQDLYKDGVEELDQETARSLSSRANFLNGEPQWVTPLFLSRRFQAEQVAVMGLEIVRVMAERVSELEAIFEFMTGRDARPKTTKAKSKSKTARAPRKPETLDPDKQFVYVARLKPLHIRRGFVNLTPEHWEFFASTARATTREITVTFEDKVDKASSVWRLSSNDMARIVLSEAVQGWLEDNFDADDKVQVTATKTEDDEIEVLLEPVE